MSNCEYVGTLERDPDGTVRIRRPHIPPAPPRTKRPIQIPLSVERQLARGNAFVTAVIGDSMQPTILDNDTIVVSSIRRPRHRDIVAVKANGPHPIYGPVNGYIWSYYVNEGRRVLRKDNPYYREEQPATREEIIGVITRIIPRSYRDEQENYLRIQQHRAFSQACNVAVPPDLGFYSESLQRDLRAIFIIPDRELLEGRLPWGAFRASAITDHPHVGITTEDILTVDPTIESRVGLLVVEGAEDGTTLLGVLQRDGLRSRHPGKFFIQTAERRVDITGEDGYPLYRTLAVIERIQRRGIVVPLPRPMVATTERRRA